MSGYYVCMYVFIIKPLPGISEFTVMAAVTEPVRTTSIDFLAIELHGSPIWCLVLTVTNGMLYTVLASMVDGKLEEGDIRADSYRIDVHPFRCFLMADILSNSAMIA